MPGVDGRPHRDGADTTRSDPRIHGGPDRVEVRGQIDRRVAMPRRRNVGEGALVITDLEVGELEAARRRDHDDLVIARDLAARRELGQGRERDPGVRTGEQAIAIGVGRGIGELGLGRDLDDALERAQGADRLLEADRVADLDRRRERGLRLDRLEVGPRARVARVERARRARPVRRRSAGGDRRGRARAASRSRRRARRRCRGCRPGSRPSRGPASRAAARARSRRSSGPRGAASSSSSRGTRPRARASCWTIVMQPSKSVSSASTSAPAARGWTSCAVEILPRGRITTARICAAAA